MTTTNRRQVSSRDTRFAKRVARQLASLNVSPNQVSTLSMIFSLASFGAFVFAHEHIWSLLIAVAFIQGRLLCNLFDGMIAIEYDRKSPVGDLYNEVPDRISDALIILGAGVFASDASMLGLQAMNLAWACVFLSTLTAYVRVFGAALISRHYFLGPMAKQHRMFLICVGSVVNIFVHQALAVAMIVMTGGLVVTVIRRLLAIAADLRRSHS